MKKQKIEGFTLVELIVVITILSILGSVAFVSFQGFASNGRDSRRITDINTIISQIELQKIQGVDQFAFVEGNSALISNQEGSPTSCSATSTTPFSSCFKLAGIIGTNNINSGETNYSAGIVNSTALSIDEEMSQDPSTGDEYKIGVTTFASQYEIAGTIENEDSPKAYIDGSWIPRVAADTSLTGNLTSGENVFYTDDPDASSTGLRVGDNIKWASDATVYVITRISGNAIYLDQNVSSNRTTIELRENETIHLVSRYDNNAWWIDETRGATHVPYSLTE